MRKQDIVFRKQTDDLRSVGAPRGEVSLHAGPRGYLWIGPLGGGSTYTLSGRATLRELARAILRHIPAPAKKAKAKR